MYNVQQIAQMCHETNKAWCEANGDFSQLSWANAPSWQKESAIAGVEFRLENPSAPDSASHDSWLAVKIEAGWTYGEVKDAVKKTHPCILPYFELPEVEKRKDALFGAIVTALTVEC